MIERNVDVTTRYGRQPAFAVCPDASGPFPAIILYMDAPGIREELRNHARRIAKAGYYCLLPDLYYRLGAIRFDLPRRNDAMSAVIRSAMQSLSNAALTDDTAGMLAFLDAQQQVQSGPVGCVGHCMSGAFALVAATRFPRIKAAASLYGVSMVTEAPDSPHRLVAQIEGELYIAFAETDASVPANVATKLQEALLKAGTRHTLETIPGTSHGFCFAARTDYNAVAAEAVWNKLFALWQRNLR